MPRTAVFTAVLALVGPVASGQDLAKELKSKDPAERARVVLRIANSDDPKREELLARALGDDDWGVAESASAALAERGGEKVVDELVESALEAPPALLRTLAAEALAQRAPEAGASALGKKLGGKTAQRAHEALAIVLRSGKGKADAKALRRTAERGKELELRAVAARCALLAAADERKEILAALLKSESTLVRCAVLDEVRRAPRPGDASVLADQLAAKDLSDVVERRVVHGLQAAVLADGAAFAQVEPVLASKDALAAARAARVATVAPDALKPRLAALLEPALAHSGALARLQATLALAKLGEPATARLKALAESDADARVRSAALRAYARLGATHTGPGLELLLGRLARDTDATVRQDAAVLLAQKGLVEVIEPLARALADADWGVSVCAAVSLGRTRHERAIEPLAALSKHAEWQRRAGAVVGLARAYQRQALPFLIDALGDADASVKRPAHLFLRALAREDLPAEPAPWKAWWEKSGGGVRLIDPETKTEMEKRFGRSGTVAPEVFRDLDLTCLDSRGDHIQNVLGRLKIEHELTAAGAIDEAGLSPDGLFVANCTGEIEAGDVDRLRWFTLAGGSLFGSCWALTETIGRAAPGVLGKVETASEVLAEVAAELAVDVGNESTPVLEGVFPARTTPVYALQGAYLVEVLDPGRAEVLVDSPACAEKYGTGTLAAWFPLGHGTVLDSANHFEAQGLELASGLKSRIDRQAFAVDHMAYPLEELRATRGEPWWDNSLKASQHVLDLSVLKLVTNLIRLRRLTLGD